MFSVRRRLRYLGFYLLGRRFAKLRVVQKRNICVGTDEKKTNQIGAENK